MSVPARLVLQQAEATNAALGHVNLGALSESHGFVSTMPPIVDLPAPFSAWTDAAASLPTMCDGMVVRRTLDKLPLLNASPETLPDRYLMRASSVLGLLTQAYFSIEVPAPARIPDALLTPWETVAWRLDKPRWTMSTTDYMFHNWRYIDPDAPSPMRVENLKLLTSVWNNPGTEVFMLVVLEMEMLAQSAPLIGAVVRAQEAVVQPRQARASEDRTRAHERRAQSPDVQLAAQGQPQPALRRLLCRSRGVDQDVRHLAVADESWRA